MGMYYCSGCDDYHDSRGDAGYNVTTDGKQYCDDTKPEFDPVKEHLAIRAHLYSRYRAAGERA